MTAAHSWRGLSLHVRRKRWNQQASSVCNLFFFFFFALSIKIPGAAAADDNVPALILMIGWGPFLYVLN